MSALGHREPGRLLDNWHLIGGAVASLVLAQACGQIINQSEDPPELDVMNGKGHRPVPAGRITAARVRAAGLIAGMASAVCAFATGPRFGIGVLLLLFFSVFYSVEPIRAKKRRTLGTLWLGISRGLLPLPVVWSVLYNPLEPVPLLLGSILFLWVTGFQITKDFPDVTGDRKCGIPTVPVVYGMDGAKVFMHWMNGLAFAMLGFLILFGALGRAFGIAMAVCPLGVLVINGMGKNRASSRRMENGAGWTFFYLGLGVLYVLFTLAAAMP